MQEIHSWEPSQQTSKKRCWHLVRHCSKCNCNPKVDTKTFSLDGIRIYIKSTNTKYFKFGIRILPAVFDQPFLALSRDLARPGKE